MLKGWWGDFRFYVRSLWKGYSDPVTGCDLYQTKGCAHVDGVLCDFPHCSMLADFKANRDTPKQEVPSRVTAPTGMCWVEDPATGMTFLESLESM